MPRDSFSTDRINVSILGLLKERKKRKESSPTEGIEFRPTILSVLQSTYACASVEKSFRWMARASAAPPIDYKKGIRTTSKIVPVRQRKCSIKFKPLGTFVDSSNRRMSHACTSLADAPCVFLVEKNAVETKESRSRSQCQLALDLNKFYTSIACRTRKRNAQSFLDRLKTNMKTGLTSLSLNKALYKVVFTIVARLITLLLQLISCRKSRHTCFESCMQCLSWTSVERYFDCTL